MYIMMLHDTGVAQKKTAGHIKMLGASRPRLFLSVLGINSDVIRYDTDIVQKHSRAGYIKTKISDARIQIHTYDTRNTIYNFESPILFSQKIITTRITKFTIQQAHRFKV